MDYILQDFLEYIYTIQEKNQQGLIALEGTWGSGKSYLLNSFIKHLEEENETIINGVNKKYCYCIKYNAWEHNDSENPIISLLESILIFLDQTLVKFNSDIKQRNRLEQLESAGSTLLEVLSYFASLIPNCGSLVSSGMVFASKKLQKKVKKTLHNSQQLVNVQETYTKVKNGLNNLCKSANIVLLVDDLDRCMPNIQLKLLESLHHICDGAKFLVVVSLVPKQLTATLMNFYGGEIDANNYLSKVFNSCFILENSKEKRKKLDKIRLLFKINNKKESDLFDKIESELSNDPEFTMREIEKAKQVIQKTLTIKDIKDRYEANRFWQTKLFIMACAFAKGNDALQALLDLWPDLHKVSPTKSYSRLFNIIDKIVQRRESGGTNPIFNGLLMEDIVINTIKSTFFSNLDTKI